MCSNLNLVFKTKGKTLYSLIKIPTNKQFWTWTWANTHLQTCVLKDRTHHTAHTNTTLFVLFISTAFSPSMKCALGFCTLRSNRPSAGRLHKSSRYLLAASWASRSDVLLRHISVTHASVLLFMSRCPRQLHNDKVITWIILAPKLHVLLRPLHALLPCEFVWSNAVIFIFLTLDLPLPFPLPRFSSSSLSWLFVPWLDAYANRFFKCHCNRSTLSIWLRTCRFSGFNQSLS